jgi:hypothetical protein
MIALMLAAAAQLSWTGPRTEQYSGPGFFCGGGYRVQLLRGDRALILPQGSEIQGARLVLSGREVNVWTGAHREAGRLVSSYGPTEVTQQQDDRGIVSYIVSNDTDFGLRLTSDAFHGYKQDKWFFTRVKFSQAAENSVQCLAAYSY